MEIEAQFCHMVFVVSHITFEVSYIYTHKGSIDVN